MELTKEITIKLSLGELIAIGTYIEERITQEFGHEPTKEELLMFMNAVIKNAEEKPESKDTERHTRLLAAISANINMKKCLMLQMGDEYDNKKKTARA